MKIEYTVPNDLDQVTLKTILQKKLNISTNFLNKLKLSNCIFVNNKLANVNTKINKNDKILVDMSSLFKNTNIQSKFPAWKKELDILFEDEYLIILNKPNNMPVHPSPDNFDKTLANSVLYYFLEKKYNIQNIHIVTRLDKDTSGICVIAKNSYIQELILRKKDEIDFKKYYIAIVDGIVKNDSGVIEENISRKENSIILREVNINGAFAKTEYLVLKRNTIKNYTIIKILLHTGRTHQIRVHFSHIGHTLLGDDLYYDKSPKENILALINRQALHCSNICFNHPITNEKIDILATLPSDMNNLI